LSIFVAESGSSETILLSVARCAGTISGSPFLRMAAADDL